MVIKNINIQTPKEDIKTPQQLIHIKHTINLQQYKYWMLMLKTFKDGVDKEGKGVEQISISTLEKWIGYKLKRIDLENDLIALRKETVAMNMMSKDKKNPVFRVDGFINNARIEDGVIHFGLGDWLKEAIHSLANQDAIFNLLNWSIFHSFSGKYEAILYKLCKDYLGVGRTKNMTIKEYRGYMGLRDHEYSQFKELNRFIISAPVKAINNSEISDILISAVFSKVGRSVVSVYFNIMMKTDRAVTDFSCFSKALIPISAAKKVKYLNEFSSKEIELSIERANDYIAQLEKKGKAVKSIASIYKRAITENYGLELSEQRELDLLKSQEQLENARLEQINIQKNKLLRENEKLINDRLSEDLWVGFMKLSEDEQSEFISKNFDSNMIVKKMFKQHGYTHIIVKNSIIGVLKSKKIPSQ